MTALIESAIGSLLDIDADLVRFVIYALLGALMRMAFGLYKAYLNDGYVRPNFKRVGLEIVASVVFGSTASILLSQTGMLFASSKAGTATIAFIGGLLGSDLLNRLAEQMGIPKGISTAFQNLPSDLNDRQKKALQYIVAVGSISNGEYEKLNRVSDSSAQRDLADLVKKRYLSRKGKLKETRYYL